MNWIRENKFLAVFGGIVAALAIVLAVMLYMAIGEHDEVATQYNAQESQLHSLQSMQPYPEQKNLQKKKVQKDAYVASIQKLQARLAGMQYPLEAIEPAAFQDLLKSEVSKALEKAKANGTSMPDGFYFGFTEYQSAPPLREAAAPLAKELKAISFVVNQLLDAKVASIDDVNRSPLSVEAKPVATSTPRGPASRAGAAAAAALMVRKPFEVSFTSEQGKFRTALNAIGAASEQFLSIRNLRVLNEQPKAPARVDPNAAPAAAAQPASGAALPVPGAKQDKSADNAWLKPILGREKVNVTLAIDIIDFAQPAAATASK